MHLLHVPNRTLLLLLLSSLNPSRNPGRDLIPHLNHRDYKIFRLISLRGLIQIWVRLIRLCHLVLLLQEEEEEGQDLSGVDYELGFP